MITDEENGMKALGHSFEHKPCLGIQTSLNQPKACAPLAYLQFGGVTGTLQDRHWVSPESFQKVMGVSSTPYIGKLPPVFVQLMKETQESPKQIYQALDELIPILRGLKSEEGVFQFQIGRSQTPITLKFIGSGAFGSVYNLSFKDQHFALKVYHCNNLASSHGTFGESSTGLYLGKRPMKDIAQFYFGNPKAGWGVYELISKDMRSHSRSGQSIHSLPMILGDEHEDNNINDIRVDYGGLSKGVRPKNFDDYKKAMAFKDPTVQALAASKIWTLPYEFREKAFQMAMDINHSTVQGKATSTIWSLPDDIRKKAFQMAMDTNNPIVQAHVSSNISNLPENFRIGIFQMLMGTKDPTVQAQAAFNISKLPEDFRKEAFQMAMDTNNPTVQANAAFNISNLPEDFRKEAFQMAMDTNNPTVQANAASSIPSFSKDFRKQAFQMAMDTNNPTVQAQAASIIWSLPFEFRIEAFLMAKATKDPITQCNAQLCSYSLPEDF
ncbi:MAG: hypothetical protein K2X66_18825 [Cyanobacteria bacterium]|nr:hypothetical protein [Cyanobacteriota bacterium]